MLKYYKLTFTEDRKNYRTMVVPAHSLAEAYIEIQSRFPGAEITEYTEGNATKESWAQPIARYIMAHAKINELRTFISYLDDEKREELVDAIWNTYHHNMAKGGVI